MPQRLAPDSFRGQVVAIAAAVVAVAALAFMMVREAAQGSQQRLTEEAREQCEAAARELATQLHERLAYSGTPLSGLPPEAQDVSLQGLSSTVLRSYEGVAGGYLDLSGSRVTGYTFPTGAAGDTAPDADRLKRMSNRPGGRASQSDGLRVIAVERLEQQPWAAWSRKNVAAVTVAEGRLTWVVALVAAALLGLGGIVSIWFSMRRGIQQVKDGLGKLESDFSFRLPAGGAEFAQITQAINQMAERRAALEEQYRRQDRLAALGKVVAGVAHEIRNPLNSMRLTLELLSRRMQQGRAVNTEVEAAIQEVDRLDAILRRLLAFGRPAGQERKRQDVRPLVDRAVKMVMDQSQQKQVEITTRIEGGELEAEVDAGPLEQVLINLLLNAVEACSGGEGKVRVSARDAGDGIVIEVADNGPGIPPAARPHVFDAFYSTKPNGTGLGLAVSREILLAQQGELEFETGNEGTMFRVRLAAGSAAE
jgi:signal transduction histidine kinase